MLQRTPLGLVTNCFLPALATVILLSAAALAEEEPGPLTLHQGEPVCYTEDSSKYPEVRELYPDTPLQWDGETVQTTVLVAELELDGDPWPEYLVLEANPIFCGSLGCPVHVLDMTNRGLEALSGELQLRRWSWVLESTSNGLHDLAFMAPPSCVTELAGQGVPFDCPALRYAFDGESYHPNGLVDMGRCTRCP